MCAAGPRQDACCLQPLTFLLDDQEHTVALAQWGEAAASQDSLRAAAMVNMSPIHSYLFSPDGNLLHANETAAVMVNKSGTQLSLAVRFMTAGCRSTTASVRACEQQHSLFFKCSFSGFQRHEALSLDWSNGIILNVAVDTAVCFISTAQASFNSMHFAASACMKDHHWIINAVPVQARRGMPFLWMTFC